MKNMIIDNFLEGINLVYNPNDKFKDVKRKNLVSKLTEIARDGFGSSIAYDDVENHVLHVDALYLIYGKNDLIGFSSYDFITFKGKNILYLSGIVVKRDFQKNGLFNIVNKSAISQGNFDFLTMRTQNPVIYGATNKIVETLYPHKSKDITSEIKEVGIYLAKEKLKMRQFDEENFIGRETYGQSLYDFIPEYSGAKEFFDNILKLNYKKGDSVILVGVLKNEKNNKR